MEPQKGAGKRYLVQTECLISREEPATSTNLEITSTSDLEMTTYNIGLLL